MTTSAKKTLFAKFAKDAETFDYTFLIFIKLPNKVQFALWEIIFKDGRD